MEFQTLRFREPFRTEFASFVRATGPLTAALETVLYRRIDTPSHVDNEIMSLGIAAYMDFKELVILCESGYGLGSLKQLRCLYERVLSAQFLSREPDQVKRFQGYYVVHHHKIRAAALKLYSADQLEGTPFNQDFEDLFNEVKGDFQDTVCDECKRKRVSSSWGPPIEQMAKRVGGLLEKMYLYWYLMPTMTTHTSKISLLAYMKLDDKGALTTIPDCQEHYLSYSLQAGHRLIVSLLAALIAHFTLGLEQTINQCEEDIATCWGELAQ